MRKTVIALCVLALAISACSRGVPPEKQRCRSALAQSQKFRTFPASDLINALAGSSYGDVNIVLAQGSRPQGATRGTLVVETNSRLGASEAQQLASPVMNIYCI